MTLVAADGAILSIGEGGANLAVAGLRRHSLILNRVLTDTTTTEDLGWISVSPRQGPASGEIRGEGVFLSSEASSALRDAFLNGADEPFSLLLPGEGTWSAQFFVRSLTYAGRSEGEEDFAVRLASTGPVIFTPMS